MAAKGNKQNLIPQAHKLTTEERSAGGKASGETRRKKRDLKSCLDILLEADMKGKNGKEMTGAMALATALFKKAASGDVHAFIAIRDTDGQKPAEKVLVGEIDPEIEREVEDVISEIESEENGKSDKRKSD